ncbi:MAG TPA: ABC transporter substrate-binding protein [Rectinemataceae bacterium]|nr:ABC transporter substrate-binding protein [Rectinemataceae bacterium]
MSGKKGFIFLMLCALLFTGLSSAGAQNVIKIGFLTPLSGNNANYGKQCLQAGQMIADIINEDYPQSALELGPGKGLPNLGGARIQLVVADHKSDPEIAVAEAKRLIAEEHVVAITGQYTSAITKAVAVVTEQYKIPLLTAGSAVSLTDGTTDLSWYFRFGLNDATYIKDTFAFVDGLNKMKKAGLKTVAFMSEDTEFGANIVKQEVKYAKEFGMEVVANIIYPSNSTNLTSEALKIKKANPDVLIMASYTSDGILFLNTIKEQNWVPRMLIGQRGGFVQQDFLDALGKDTEYICTTGGWSSDLALPASKELVKLYPSKFSNGIDLNEGHVKDMSNVLILAVAINQAGTTEANALKKALMNLKLDLSKWMMPWSGVTMDSRGQNTSSAGVIMQMLGGKYKTVYPAKAQAAEAVFAMPAWNKR